jgi:ketosteroid isomerase-like protein
VSIEIARRYLSALEAWDEAGVAELLAPGFAHEEHPSRLVPNGQTRDRATSLAAVSRGAAILSKHAFTIERFYEAGLTLILEITWRGVLKIPPGTRKPGDTMTADFFLDFEDGKIARQRHDDCYEPF